MTDKIQKDKVQEILSKYRKAGQISIKAKTLARKICKPRAKVYDICEEIEALIFNEKARLAFPVNVSFNNEAAHYSAEILDNRVVGENSIVKIDLGVHIDGYIVDTAVTINNNPELEELTLASIEALDAAIAIIKPGVKATEVGKKVEKVITSRGFQPVRNLTGHQIKRYNLHAGVSIPNCGRPKFFDGKRVKLEVGRVYAIEPFASTGEGWIQNGKTICIYRYARNPGKKTADLKSIASKVKNKVGILPFSPRHLHDKSTGQKGKEEVMLNIGKLMRGNIIMGYPVLEEASKKVMISQAEHTIRITKTGCEVFT